MDLICAGRTFILHGVPEGSHLWVALTDRDPESDQILAVMVVTTKPHTDKAVLHAGDHPNIDHDSSLDCGCAKRMKVRKLEAAVATGRCVLQADLSRELLKTVRDAFLRSARTPYAQADYARARMTSEP